MPKVFFKFNKERDLWNHWHKANWKSSFGNFKTPQKIKELCNGKEFEECKEDLSILLSNIHHSKLIPSNIKSINMSWKSIEKEFFYRMDKLMQKKFEKDIVAYLTTSRICPYNTNEPSFMFSLFHSLPSQLQTCGHEIMHLYFHKFYWNAVEKEIGKEKTGDLKEALSVLLNMEFRDLWLVEDYGYESHNELREFIIKNWNEEKDFEKLLKKCIHYLKK